MKLTTNQKNKLKVVRHISLAGIFLGLSFVFFAHGTSRLFPYVSGAIVGLVAGLMMSYLELYLFTRKIRKIKFIWLLTLKSLIYLLIFTIIIFNIVVFSRMYRLQMTYIEVLNAADFQYYISNGTFKLEILYTISFAFIIIFTRMVDKKMGQGILANYIKGKYFEPIHEARIVLFINIADSNQLLNKLGPLKFHKFLNQYYSDLTLPAISNGGIIHEYIEDLMVVSWTMNIGLTNANCIKTFFNIKSTIDKKKIWYLKQYGFMPRIRAGLHTGSLVTSEIGEIKTQIVFHGNTMNTTSRILDKCYEFKLGLLASDQLIRMLGMTKNYNLHSVGNIQLKGKQKGLELFEIKDKN